ncbi:hypothetical protein [Sphingomonas sp. Leaf10]|uniref:hypothetical protein n=1 Tax=Sphingomonas sp. Leaf10 TaxID=1735676 RepID=UPI0012E2AF07|nr:hypothetical protein [Sphingomonas sp. Leaf10]
MSERRRSSLPRHGAKTASEIYQLVGSALSWWEASEDEIMGLFRLLCMPGEPVAMQTFVASSRSVRYRMLQEAMIKYSGRIDAERIAKVKAALVALNRLAQTRNQIAHGYVGEHNHKVGDEVVASGNYLLPSYNEAERIERQFRYSHVPKTIASFIADVRHQRGEIMDVADEVAKGEQDRQQIRILISNLSDCVARSKLPYYDIEEALNDLLGRMAGS